MSSDAWNGEITPVQQLVAASSGALMTSLLVTPLDVVKTRLQAQVKSSASISRCYIFCNGLMDHLCLCNELGSPFRPLPSAVPHPPFTSTLDALIKIPQYEGFSTLWRGLPPTLVMAVPTTVIYYTLYDQLKFVFGFKQGETNTWSPLLAGVSGRTAAVAVISPLELVRTKVMAKRGSGYKELVSAVRGAVEQNGVLSLWQGLGPTLWRDVPFSAIYWYGYENIKASFADPTLSVTFVSGALSGMVAAVCTMPFDVVKTHRQMELGETPLNGASKTKPFTYTLLLKLYREKGLQGLFAGLTPRLMRIMPACAIMISSYEFGKKFFKEHNRRKVIQALEG